MALDGGTRDLSGSPSVTDAAEAIRRRRDSIRDSQYARLVPGL